MRNSFLAGAALLGLTASASASSFEIINVGEAYSLQGVVLTGGTLPTPHVVHYAGQIDLTTSSGAVFPVWCVDLNHVIQVGAHSPPLPYTPGPLTTDNTGSTPATSAPLSQTQINEISVLGAWGNAKMVAAPTNDWSAAISAAIWDSEYGTTASYAGDAGFGADLSYIEANVLPFADHFVGGVQLSDIGAQGQFLSQGQFLPGAPEPRTWVMMAIGFFGLWFTGAKARRAATATAGRL